MSGLLRVVDLENVIAFQFYWGQRIFLWKIFFEEIQNNAIWLLLLISKLHF